MLILAHRGSTADGVYENTIDAFQLAKERGASGIETDVRKTKDDELILFHNNSIGKKAIRKLTYKQVQQRVGYKVSTLNELLRWADSDFILNLEIKDFDIAPEMIAELKGRWTKRQLFVSSFNHPTAFAISRSTNTPCGIIMSIRPMIVKAFFYAVPAMVDYIIWDYDIYDSIFRAELPRYKHLVYNVNELLLGKTKKADGIISDHLDRHVQRKKVK